MWQFYMTIIFDGVGSTKIKADNSQLSGSAMPLDNSKARLPSRSALRGKNLPHLM